MLGTSESLRLRGRVLSFTTLPKAKLNCTFAPRNTAKPEPVIGPDKDATKNVNEIEFFDMFCSRLI